jgi:DNA polymerase-3 subunit beta
MKFTVHKKDLIATLTKIQGISSSRKSNLAITACILIKADADTITIKATDLETGFEGIFRPLLKLKER